MKKIFKNLGFILALATVVLWSCEDEWEAPTAEPNHAYITTSFGVAANRLQINDAMTLIDLSRGVESRTWTFNSGVTDTSYNAISSSVDQSVKVRFVSTGEHQVKLAQTYAGNVYIGETQSSSASFDTTLTITVVDSIRANFVAKRMEDNSVLNHSANALNEIVAGREVEFSFEGTGEPSDFTWTITRSDGFVTTATDNPAAVKFSSLGDYDVKVAASSSLGSDSYELEKYITVIPSTDPVELMDMIIDKRDEIRITFSRDMQNPFNCDPAAFTLSVINNSAEVPVAISGFSLDEVQNNIVIVELAEPLFNSDMVSISYNEELGNIATADYMDATSFEYENIQFVSENLLVGTSYDYSFDNTTADQMPYLWWGAPWDAYNLSMSSAITHSGTQSCYMDMNPEGGMIIDHRDAAGTQHMFTAEAGKEYVFGIWLYVEEMDAADLLDQWAPDLRFFPNVGGAIDWGTTIAFFLTPETPKGKWVYKSVQWKPAAAGDTFFLIRGFNQHNSTATKFYMDDIEISELEVRQ